MKGTEFVETIRHLTGLPRERLIRQALEGGSEPESHKKWVRVVHQDGTHVLAFDCAPDYVSIGDDGNYVRMPMFPATAWAYAARNNAVLPVTRLVDVIWAAATKLGAHTFQQDRAATTTYLLHHQKIQANLPPEFKLGMLVAGHKKDIVLDPKAPTGRVSIYGWQGRKNPKPIQPLYSGHANNYVDYSHGARLVACDCLLDGKPTTLRKISEDPQLCSLLGYAKPFKYNPS